jgi:hypothetical protein
MASGGVITIDVDLDQAIDGKMAWAAETDEKLGSVLVLVLGG